MLTKTADGKIKDVAITEVTAENYIVPDGEKHLYHCKIEIRKFNPETGARLSIPRIQKFGVKIFETNIAHNLKQQGYTIDVLHDPTEYLKEQAAKAAETKEQSAKAIAAAKAAEREALKAELMAEIKAELKAKETTKKTK